MKDKILAWLSTFKAPFAEGVALYFAYGSNLLTKHKLLQGESPENRTLLRNSLLEIPGIREARPAETQPPASTTPTAAHTALVAALRQEAHLHWKELMNMRAVLFRLCRHEVQEAENEPQKVQIRGKMALDIILYNRKVVTPAYDKVRYAEQHGTLPPDALQAQEAPEDYLHLPDHKVKSTIDNIRKNLSKLRKREPSPERLALIARHESNLEKLLARWHSLK